MGKQTLKCKGCGRTFEMTWSLAKAQYGRMLRRGATEEQAKEAGPRCPKCTTRWLREHGL